MIELDEKFLKIVIPITQWWYDVIVAANAYHESNGEILVLNNHQKVRPENEQERIRREKN